MVLKPKGDSTVAFDGAPPREGPEPLPAKGGEERRSVSIDELFAGKTRLLIGRGEECDVRLDHPSISRVHVLVERLPQGLRLRDLGSLNGVLIGGRRLHEPTFLPAHERVGIGPYLISHANGLVYTVDSSHSLRLEAHHLERVVRGSDGRQRKLLDDINLALEPGEFVCLLGPSGSGKSTLMDCLNGRRPATGGRVLANGEDFYRYFDSFRQSLGYVPQRDIVHTGLTVSRALYYTARLRLPTDTGPSELEARLDEVVQLMELEPHRDTLVADLSGGQIKRVSLGAELLARPCLLYIDEATSGLDAGTEARMMRMFRRLADEGKSIVCITHNVDNVDLCNLVAVLMRGRLVFYGPPAEARNYFAVARVSEIYDKLQAKSPEAWEKDYRASSLHAEFVARRLGSSVEEKGTKGVTAVALPRRRRPWPPILHQFGVLTARYAELLWKDPRTLRLLLLQAPIVAAFLLLGFIGKPYQDTIMAPRRLDSHERSAVGKMIEARRYLQELDPSGDIKRMLLPYIDPDGHFIEPVERLIDEGVVEKMLTAPVVPGKVMVNPRYTYMLLFILVISILWFGCNNAAKEIVKEEPIYARERAVNLGIFPYLASKFVVLTFVSAVQTFLMMAIVYGVLQALQDTLGWKGPYPRYYLALVPQYGVLLALSMTGVALGLFLSACVSSPDRATTLLPYVLIPQIILGGGIMPIQGEPLHMISLITSPAYWAFRAVRRWATELPADFPGHMEYDDNPWISVGALAAQLTVLLAVTAWFLRRKDVRRA